VWCSQEGERAEIGKLVWQQQAMQSGLGKTSHRRQSSDNLIPWIAVELATIHGREHWEKVVQPHMICSHESADPRQQQLMGKRARGKWQSRNGAVV
jgi:hypothetical protein